MYATISITVDFPVYPERVYRAWMDSYEHSRFTGNPAKISGKTGENFITIGGQVKSVIQVATPFTRIVQTWKVTQFPQNAPDSSIELKFEPTCTGAEVELTHHRRGCRQYPSDDAMVGGSVFSPVAYLL